MKTYEKAVKENLAHMGTTMSEWSAVPVSGMNEIEGTGGQVVSMPVFDFPTGYEKAPTLFASDTSDTNCEWCGTRIKRLFWIQNHKRKWILSVGSECVTHFENGRSGKQLVKEKIWEQNRDLLRSAIAAKHDLYSAFARKIYRGYGRYGYEIGDNSARGKVVLATYQGLVGVIGNLMPDPGRSAIETASSNGAISRWANAKKEVAAELIQNAYSLIEEVK